MRPRAQKWHVCSHAGPDGSCPELVNRDNPCPKHGRPVNASWSTDRDRGAQRQFRARVLEHDGYRCTRCGHVDPSGRSLDAHHVTPTEGVTLCNSKGNGCHGVTDRNAR
jgi:hypothetical protein